MDAIILQILNGLDKGGAYALIALGLTLIFGTLGVVNFAHGALFMLGAFCVVTLNKIFTISYETIDPVRKDFLGNPLKVETPYIFDWFGPDVGAAMIEWSVPLAILFSLPIMVLIGLSMERGLIKYFYKRPHADQILVTFGLAIVLQEIIKYFYGANPIPTPDPPLSPAVPISAFCSASMPVRSYTPIGAWFILCSPPPSSAGCSPSCDTPPSEWSFAPVWLIVRLSACSVSISTSGSRSCLHSRPLWPGLLA